MRQAQRFMRRQRFDPNDTADTLRLFLESAPGVTGVHEVEQHRKGGFRAVFELDHQSLDFFLAELDRHDWMSVM